MTPNFKTAVEVILSHEGKYVNNPNDPGKETNYGISKKAYPDLDIKNLTRQDAMAIYYRDYWQPIRGDKLPLGLAILLLDIAVNAGVSKAVKMLQRASGSKIDGKFGDLTLAASLAHNKNHLIEEITKDRIMHYAGLPTFSEFGKGWVSRAVETMSTALLIRDYM